MLVKELGGKLFLSRENRHHLIWLWIFQCVPRISQLLIIGYIVCYRGLLFLQSSLFPSGRDCSHVISLPISTMTSQITNLTIVYSTVYSAADEWKHQSAAALAFVRGIEFPAQRDSSAENVSIWWRHHVSNNRWKMDPGLPPVSFRNAGFHLCILFIFIHVWVWFA